MSLCPHDISITEESILFWPGNLYVGPLRYMAVPLILEENVFFKLVYVN